MKSPSTAPVLPLGAFVLRPLRPSDRDAWYAYLGDARTTEHTSWPEVSPEMISRVLDRLIREYASRASLRWALARARDDELIGTCGFTRIDERDAVGELAYDLAPEYWGRGIMRAAVDAAADWAFSTGELRRVEALVMATNNRSIALLERSGFARERFLPSHRLARGVPHDFWRYARERGGIAGTSGFRSEWYFAPASRGVFTASPSPPISFRRRTP